MNDEEQNDSACGDGTPAEADDAPAADNDAEQRDSTLLGQGFELPSPGDNALSDGTASSPGDAQGTVPDSLSKRLKKLASDSSDAAHSGPKPTDSEPDAISVSDTSPPLPVTADDDAPPVTASDSDGDEPDHDGASADGPPGADGSPDADSHEIAEAPTDRLDTMPLDIDDETAVEQREDRVGGDTDDQHSSVETQRSTHQMHSPVDAQSQDTDVEDADHFDVEPTVLTEPRPPSPQADIDDGPDTDVEDADNFDVEPTVLTTDSDFEFDADQGSPAEPSSDEFDDEKTQVSESIFSSADDIDLEAPATSEASSPSSLTGENTEISDSPVSATRENSERAESSPQNTTSAPEDATGTPEAFEVPKTEISPNLPPAERSHDGFRNGDEDGDESYLVEDTDASSPPRAASSGDDADSARPGENGSRTSEIADAPSSPTASTPETAADDKDFETDDTEFEAGATELFDSPFENDPICPRLTTLEGPAVGQDFFIDNSRNTIGRATDNTVVIADRAMSRKHFEIIQNPDDTYQLNDLKAVNGTSLNGVDIKEADLFHGDRIAAGQSTFQFVIPGDAPVQTGERHLIPAASSQTVTDQKLDAVEAPGPGDSEQDRDRLDTILLAVTVIAGLLCIPLLGILVQATVLDDGSEESASDLYFQGVEAMQSAQWEEAEQLFIQSRDVDSQFGEIDAQLARIEREQQAHSIIERARQQAEDGIDADAVSELRSLSPESHYYDDAQQLLSQAHQDQALELYDRALEAYENDDLEQAVTALDELRVVAPQYEPADDLQRDIEAALEEQPASDDDHQDDSGQPSASPSPEPQTGSPQRPSEPEPPSESEDDDEPSPLGDPFAEDEQREEDRPEGTTGIGQINFTDGFSMYRDERFDDAIEHFETIADRSSGAVGNRAAQTADDIQRFHDSLREGRQARDDGDYETAIDAFRTARQADESVAGEGGSFQADVGADMSSAVALEGRQHLEVEDYSAAFDRLERAEAHDPSTPEVEALHVDLENRAQSLYIQAANQRKSDPEGAAELAREILTMIPQDHDTHSRALELLDELD